MLLGEITKSVERCIIGSNSNDNRWDILLVV